jgi:formate hydrogenlyase subunit 6/NADH:ubiquinone oxidoreductase subunit I
MHDEQWNEYFAMNDQQNALALSRMEAPADDSQRIAAAIDDGLCVLCEQRPTYCPRTDATMGTATYLLASGSREHCEAKLDDLRNEDDCDRESWIYILPRLPVELVEATEYDQLIPF